MKNFLLFLSFILWSLLGAKGIEGALPSDEGTGMESVLQAETSTGYILPLVTEMPDEGEAYVDTENLARQYRVVGRGQRLFSVQQMFWVKVLHTGLPRNIWKCCFIPSTTLIPPYLAKVGRYPPTITSLG